MGERVSSGTVCEVEHLRAQHSENIYIKMKQSKVVSQQFNGTIVHVVHQNEAHRVKILVE